MKRGLAIAFDGPDGVGKSTQLELAAEWLETLGHDVHTARASGGTPIGEELRKASLSDNPRSAIVDVYISLAMHTALGEDITRRVALGQTCLIDRSPLAIMGYNAYGSQLEDKQRGIEACKEMFRLWQLDALFVFDANQTVLNGRRQTRTDKPSDYFEKQDAAYHERVRQGYEAGVRLLEESPHLVRSIIHIDAEPEIEAVRTAVHAELSTIV